MRVRVKDNLWTRIEWWDQLAKTDYDIVLKRINEDKTDTVLSLSHLRSQEKLVDLLDDIHMAVINNAGFFDVPQWVNRAKKRKKASEK